LNEHTYISKGDDRIALVGVGVGHNFKKQEINKGGFKRI
jgi:hypothetical protein